MKFFVRWSEPDQEYVGTCDGYPSLSWLSASPLGAMMGIRRIVQEVEADLERERSEKA